MVTCFFAAANVDDDDDNDNDDDDDDNDDDDDDDFPSAADPDDVDVFDFASSAIASEISRSDEHFPLVTSVSTINSPSRPNFAFAWMMHFGPRARIRTASSSNS